MQNCMVTTSNGRADSDFAGRTVLIGFYDNDIRSMTCGIQTTVRAYLETIHSVKVCFESLVPARIVTLLSLINRNGRNVCSAPLISPQLLVRLDLRSAPMPTYSSTPALAHLFRSPPFPQPRSKTFSRRRTARGPCCRNMSCSTGETENLLMRTVLTQLLKFFKPMMGDKVRSWTVMFCRWLSTHRTLSAMIKPEHDEIPNNDSRLGAYLLR